MNEMGERDLIELFGAFLAHYPSMRFGQALCGVASWEDGDPNEVLDAELTTAIKEHLERRFGIDAYRTGISSMPTDLVAALRDLRRQEPSEAVGHLLCRLSARLNVNPYDVENEELTIAIRIEAQKLLGVSLEGSVG